MYFQKVPSNITIRIPKIISLKSTPPAEILSIVALLLVGFICRFNDLEAARSRKTLLYIDETPHSRQLGSKNGANSGIALKASKGVIVFGSAGILRDFP